MKKLFGILLFAGLSAHASSLPPMTADELLGQAPVIVRGRVGESRSQTYKGRAQGEDIFTLTDVLVSEVLKGEFKGQTLRLRQFGGSDGGRTIFVPGTAELRSGDEVVLLLGRYNPDDDTYESINLSRGVFRVQGKGEMKITDLKRLLSH
jgi:hypothetical protein